MVANAEFEICRSLSTEDSNVLFFDCCLLKMFILLEIAFYLRKDSNVLSLDCCLLKMFILLQIAVYLRKDSNVLSLD